MVGEYYDIFEICTVSDMKHNVQQSCALYSLAHSLTHSRKCEQNRSIGWGGTKWSLRFVSLDEGKIARFPILAQIARSILRFTRDNGRQPL